MCAFTQAYRFNSHFPGKLDYLFAPKLSFSIDSEHVH